MSTPERLSFARLLAWLEGELPDAEAQALADQLAHLDEATQADLAWLRAFLALSRRFSLASPPAEVRELLRRRFAEYAAARRGPSMFRRVVATLTFDSQVQWAVAGLRSAMGDTTQRQLIYSAEVADVVMNIEPRRRDQRLEVSGQIFPLAPIVDDVLSVQLLHGLTETQLTTADELGEFNLGALPAGEYDLIVSSSQFELVIPAVPLHA